MRQTTSTYLFLVVFAFSGCAATESTKVQYDPSTGESAYASDRFIMGYRNMNSGLSSNQRVMWQAVASCSGESCTPGEVTLVFFNDTSQDLNIDSSRLQMIVDGTDHDWQDLSRLREVPYFTVPPGEFLRVSLPGGVFVEFAQAKKVELLFGETGTSTFNVSFERRAKFREFAEVLGLGE